MPDGRISATTEVTVTPIPGSGYAVARSSDVREWLHVHVDEIAQSLRGEAPVRSGAGRRSIISRVEMGAEGWYGTASWDPAHYYMGILNSRTGWADPTVQRVRYL